jgi:N-methylhydantoinase A
MMSCSLGIDIGGTFTDVVIYRHDDGHIFSHKELTTPSNPTLGAMTGVRYLLAKTGLQPQAIGRVVHATTLFANALIERRGAVTGLITTRGFRDTLEMRREFKYDLYDLFIELPQPLVSRELRFEINERTHFDGLVHTGVDETELTKVVDDTIAKGVTSLAISFLHAYANPANEQRAKAIIESRYPELHLSVSNEVCPQIREYERTSTTVANAYVKPIADRYLHDLESELNGLGIPGRLFMMLSSGGLTHVGEARRVPVQLLESGPAAGTIAAAFFGKRSNVSEVLAFDMGGTTAKLGTIEHGRPLISHQFEAGRQKRFAAGSGLPINISTIELIEIGAGGGSIAQTDALGLLKVGPKSAGSEPGPACYARGGTFATVTDANLLAGYLDADNFAGGTIKLDTNAAVDALRPLGEALDMELIDIAKGVQAIVNENMAAAARVHVAERGHSASDFTLLVMGGGGPLHGCDVARRLGIGRVLCPPYAGVASALGLLIAPARVDRSAAIGRTLDAILAEQLEAAFAALEAGAGRVIGDTLGEAGEFSFERSADIRFVGQGFELVVALPSGPYDQSSLLEIRKAFSDAYRRIFGHITPAVELEIMSIRVSAVESLRARPLATAESAEAERTSKPRSVYDDLAQRWSEVPVLARADLPYGRPVHGPMLIEDASSTLAVPSDGVVVRDAADNIIIILSANPVTEDRAADFTTEERERAVNV